MTSERKSEITFLALNNVFLEEVYRLVNNSVCKYIILVMLGSYMMLSIY